jgi:hypothetical protein
MGFSDLKTAARLDDMNYNRLSLRLEIAADGDVAVYIDEDGVPVADSKGNVARVEFCNPVGGGGRSTHTRRALIAVVEAMCKDAQERPDAVPQFPPGLAERMAMKNL